MDWRCDTDYAFCDQLDLAGWAWQFLRRAPEYRADYTEFIAIWRQLEASYGAPPQRDFFKWRQDPRAWRSEADLAGCGAEICPGENDQVLIECWMGAKWGFRKFPLDPAINLPDELAWREFPVDVAVVESDSGLAFPPEILALRFDLSLPLPAQLEAAKKQLLANRLLREKGGHLPPRNLRTGAPLWRLWLRLLDALESGDTPSQMAATLGLSEPEREVAAAIQMRSGGYRRILMLEH